MTVTRRAFLKTLAVVPIGIAFTRLTEPGPHLICEFWSADELVAVRQFAFEKVHESLAIFLSPEECAHVPNWGDCEVRLRPVGAKFDLEMLTLEAPAPIEWES